MCGNCKEGKCKGCCVGKKIAKILVIIGGINWGLVGVGMLFSFKNWNIVHLIFGFAPVVESIVYILVGISAIGLVFKCKCHHCKEGSCTEEGKKEEVKMPQ